MNTDIPDWINDAISFWKARKINVNSGGAIAKIDALEWELGFKLPDDFKQFYLNMDGFRENEWDENMFSIWSLTRISEEFGGSGDSGFIGFCDFMINSHCIGFMKKETGVFKEYRNTVGEPEFVKVADTFQQVILLIIENALEIY